MPLRTAWVIVAVIGLLVLAPARAAAAQEPPPASSAVAGLPAPDGSGPHLTGRTEPPLAQRIVDSLIWLWLLAALVMVPLIWVWSGRREQSPGDSNVAP
jgi:hypothetical protein